MLSYPLFSILVTKSQPGIETGLAGRRNSPMCEPPRPRGG